MQDNLDRILFIGFEFAGSWKFIDEKLALEIESNGAADSRNALYAFVVDGRLMYIGKTVQTLRQRMAGYKTPGPTQSTNVRNNRNISDSLARGCRVEIYALPDNGLLHYGGFHVNLAAGLEDSLVRDLQPPWNGGRKESSSQTLQPLDHSNVDKEGSAVEQIVPEELIDFARSTEDEELTTASRGKAFTITAAGDGVQFTPVSSGKPRRVRYEQLASVLQ